FEKIAKQFAIGFYDPARSLPKKIEMLERRDAEQLARMNRRRAVKIIQPAHFPRKIRLRQNPAASQTADAIDLCQTAGHNELWSKRERCTRCVLVNRVQINFIHE